MWRLSKRRNEAERLAFENQRLYADQRSVAQTLQHSLLPQTLPEAAGLEFGAIYAPGTEGIDIGGDWYEVVARADGTAVVVVRRRLGPRSRRGDDDGVAALRDPCLRRRRRRSGDDPRQAHAPREHRP